MAPTRAPQAPRAPWLLALLALTAYAQTNQGFAPTEAQANLGGAISAALAKCGTPCLRAGLGAPAEPGFTAAPWAYDEDYNLVLTWDVRGNATSLVTLPGVQMMGTVYAITVR